MNVNFITLATDGKRAEVALLSRCDQQVRVWWVQSADGEPAQQVLPMLHDLLAQYQLARGDLSAVAFAQGPGGFTGLRVGCGLAQGLAFALDLPVIPVSSLLAVAECDRGGAAPQKPCAWVVLQDARMEEVYLAVYCQDARTQAWQTLQPPSLIGVAALPAWLAQARAHWVDDAGHTLALRAVGNALMAYPALAALSDFDSIGSTHADVQALARLALYAWDRGEVLAPELAAPLYVRDKIAYTTRERTQGLGGNPKASGVISAVAPPVIVPMTAQHLAQVLDIECSVQSFPWTQGNFQDALRSGYDAWVVLQEGKVQGFYVLMLAPDVAHLLVLAVAAHAQRGGLGRGLIQHAQEQTRRKGLDTLLLEVRPSNAVARAFYQQLGFEPLSVRKDYYPAAHGQREDALVLRKAFSARSTGNAA